MGMLARLAIESNEQQVPILFFILCSTSMSTSMEVAQYRKIITNWEEKQVEKDAKES